MARPWSVIGGTGYDVESVPNPQSFEMQCPACNRSVRFVEKVLIKNLRIFGVPIVGIEKGRKVFECPSCQTCVEPDEVDAPPPASAEEAAPVAAAPTTLTQLMRMIEQVEFDLQLWTRRADLAREHGEKELLAEALVRADSAREKISMLRDEVANYDDDGRRVATIPSQPKVVFKSADDAKSDTVEADPRADEDFAALKRRLAARGAASAPDDSAKQNTVENAPETAEGAKSGSFSESRNGTPEPSAPGEANGRVDEDSARAVAGGGSHDGAQSESPTPTPADANARRDAADEERDARRAEDTTTARRSNDGDAFAADLAALRARLEKKRRGESSEPEARISERGTPPPQEPETESVRGGGETESAHEETDSAGKTSSGGDDEDPVSALKRRLRGD